jgi:glycerophosphoryl diester phosphodiesterase
MREVFELVKPTNLVINIEIKTGVVFYPIEEKLLALTKEFGMEDRVFYSSFNNYTVKKIHEMDPNTVVGILYGDGPIDMPEYGAKHGVNALHPALYNLQYPGFVEECKKKGLKLHVWTVNEEKYVKMCMEAQTDSVITNYPDMALRVLGR